MSRTLTLLPISDEQQSITSITTIATALGFEVLTTMTSADAPAQLDNIKPDLVLLGKTTDDLLATIQPAPILLLTAETNPEQLGKLLTQGVSDFIFTPPDSTQAQSKLQQQKSLIEQQQLHESHTRQTLKLREMGELVGLISHEVASPLGNVNTAVSFLLESSQKIQEAFDNKTLAANDLERFLKQMNKALSMSIKNADNAGGIISSFRSVATSQCLEKTNQFYVHRFIDEVILTLKSKLKKLPHEIHVVVNESIDLLTDSGAFAQLIYGLINKSIVHGFDDNVPGQVIINAALEHRDDGNVLILNYIDNGCGLTKEQLDTILVDDKTPESERLTTAMLKKIVEVQLCGTMSVESTEGSGLHYTITIPQQLK